MKWVAMDRRRFLSSLAAAAMLPFAAVTPVQGQTRPRLRLAPVRTIHRGGQPVVLSAAPGSYDLGAGPRPGALLFNQQWPSPTLRVAQGGEFDLRLDNGLDEPTIVHWHGLTPPADMDGHPMASIPAGASRDYGFVVHDRPATYWYHPHPHHRTAFQVYHGLAGFLLVEDGLDETRGLPTGSRDLPLLLADKRISAGSLQYAPAMPDMMVGFLGNTVLVNGAQSPVATVEPAVLRLRLLNGSNARILNPAFADGRPFWLVGTDGGLLDAPVPVTSVPLAPGERVEVLIDLRGEAGNTLAFVSAPLAITATLPPAIAMPPQGSAFPLLQFDVSAPLSGPPGAIPAGFEPMPGPAPGPAPVRTFLLGQQGAMHLINGASYEGGRIDFLVPLGATETWRFINQGNQPHPMHMHGSRFRVTARSGTPLASDAGWKDTVLVRVGETVDVRLSFEVPGLFVLHCHNLEHEDEGMMQNFVVGDGLFADGFEAGG